MKTGSRLGRLGALGVLGALAACSGTESTQPTVAPPMLPPGGGDGAASPAADDDPTPPEPVAELPDTTGDDGAADEGAVAEDTPFIPLDAREDDTSAPDPVVDTTVDACPDDPAKIAAGECGCGTPDEDFDRDGTMDCDESCPDNADLQVPVGACGCSSLADVAGCNQLRDAIRNLYTFDGDDVTVLDAVGGMNGTVLDASGTAQPAALAALQTNGRLNLDGFGSYVDLPDGMMSSLGNATFEVWMAWEGGAAWARIFDFGDNAGGNGVTYLFLTPLNSLTNTLRVAYSLAGPGDVETLADGLAPMSQGGAVTDHVAVVVNDANDVMELYVNGALSRSVPITDPLAQINDVNNWIGRSNYGADPPLHAKLLEFRIYDQALTATQIGTSYRAGPGALK